MSDLDAYYSTAGYEDHSDCAQCNGWDEIESFCCASCSAGHMSEENAAGCCAGPHFYCGDECEADCKEDHDPGDEDRRSR